MAQSQSFLGRLEPVYCWYIHVGGQLENQNTENNQDMKDKDKLLNTDFTINYKVLKSKNRVIVLSPITGFDIPLTAINVYESELRKTDFKLIESNEKIIFFNLNTETFFGFDKDELNLDKIYFRHENGAYEIFEVQDLKPSGDLQQYLQ